MYGVQITNFEKNITEQRYFILSRIHEFEITQQRIGNWSIDKVLESVKSKRNYTNGFIDVSIYEDDSFKNINPNNLNIVNVTNNIPFRLFAVQILGNDDFKGNYIDYITSSSLYPFFDVKTRQMDSHYIGKKIIPKQHFRIFEFSTNFYDISKYGDYGIQLFSSDGKQTYLFANSDEFMVLQNVKIASSLQNIQSGLVFAQYMDYYHYNNKVPMVDKNFKPFEGFLPDINNLNESPSAKAQIPYHMYVDTPTEENINALKKHGRYHYYS